MQIASKRSLMDLPQETSSLRPAHEPPTLALCMIVRDEEHWLATCLESVRSIVHEIIAVDTGSNDRTCEILATFGATILTRPWDDDFSAPRNLAISKAHSDWILVLDADEQIARQDLPLLQQHLNNPHFCYLMYQRHYCDDHRLSGFTANDGKHPELERGTQGYFESGLVRLFPRLPAIEYRGAVHELVEHSIRHVPGLQITQSPVRIHHYGHSHEARALRTRRERKPALYATLGERKTSEDPSNWKAFFELGVEHNNHGRRVEAEAALARASALAPQHVETLINLGYVQCELGRYAQAEQSLERALAFAPRSADALVNLGVVNMRTRKPDRAERAFRSALQHAPDHINARRNLAHLLADTGRSAEAAAVLLGILERLPHHPDTRFELGALYLAAGVREKAAQLLRSTLESHPLHPMAERVRGLLRTVDSPPR